MQLYRIKTPDDDTYEFTTQIDLNESYIHRIEKIIELKDHPFFVATQAHPEFKSRPNRAHPLFYGFIKACNEK